MTKEKRPRHAARLKLPEDFLGTVAAFLHTPAPEKPNRKAGKSKARKPVRKLTK